MSTLKVNNLQVGQHATATNNFTLYQPAVPDGTVRLGYGNVGSVTDLFNIGNTGSVGIGTNYNGLVRLFINGPDGEFLRLRTSGDVSTTGYVFQRFNDVNGSAAYIGFGGTANTFGIVNYKNGPVQIQTNNSPRLTIDGSGNVGIGVTNPDSLLHLKSTSGNVRHTIEVPDTFQAFTNYSAANSEFSIGYIRNSGSDHSFRFCAADGLSSGEIMRIDSVNQRVGIGTTNPSTKLDLVGPHSSGVITTALKISGNAWSLNGGAALEFGQDPASYPTWVTGRIASTYSGGNWGGGLKFFYNNGTTAATLTEGMELTRAGNLAFPSGNGIDFSANANAAGMTSELLNDYEEGTWTPTITGWSGTYSIQYGVYTKVGRQVFIHCEVQTTGGSGSFTISFPGVANLPFARDNTIPSYRHLGSWGFIGAGAVIPANGIGAGQWDAGPGTTSLFPNHFTTNGGVGNYNSQSAASDFGYRTFITYFTAS